MNPMHLKHGRPGIETITCPEMEIRIVLMHVHADVDQRDNRPPAAFLKLCPTAEAVDAPKDDVAFPCCLEIALPFILNGPDLRVGVNGLDHPLGHNTTRKVWQ